MLDVSPLREVESLSCGTLNLNPQFFLNHLLQQCDRHAVGRGRNPVLCLNLTMTPLRASISIDRPASLSAWLSN